jgi:peptidoglycan/LPS O-acetylase OafA/YrhL
MNTNRHLLALDIIRALAIILVILFHTQTFLFGWTGVQAFFVLSGYLITGILVQKKNSSFKTYVRNFYLSRSLRIFPIYYLYLILVSVVFLSTDNQNSFLKHWPYFYFYLADFLGFVASYEPAPAHSHLWSLAVEEQFYLIYPLLVFYCSRKSLLVTLTTIVIMGPGVRYILGTLFIKDISAPLITEQLNLYWFPFSNIDAFALGGLLKQTNFGQKLRKPGTLWSLWFLVFLLIGDFSIRLNGYPGSTLGYRAFSTQNYQHVWGYTVINVLVGLGIVTLVQWEERGHFNHHVTAAHKYFFSPIAKTSYGMYLYHPTIIAAFSMLNHVIGFSLATALAIATTFFISSLSYYYIERPFLDLKKRLCT